MNFPPMTLQKAGSHTDLNDKYGRIAPIGHKQYTLTDTKRGNNESTFISKTYLLKMQGNKKRRRGKGYLH